MINERDNALAFLVPAVLSLLLIGFFLPAIRSVDLWWHLDSGRWMIENARFLGQEVRSFSMPGAEWVNFSWLFQIIIAGVEKLGGNWGLLVFKATLWWLTLFILFYSARAEKAPVAILIVALLLSEKLFPYMYLRPHMFEGLFIAILVSLFHQPRKIALPVYVLILLPWANIHGSAIVGAIALSLHYVTDGKFCIPKPKTLLRRLPVVLLLLSLLLVTPYGIDILSILRSHTGSDFIHAYIREWYQPDPFPILELVVLLCVLSGGLLKRNLLTPAELFMILFYLVLSYNSRRFLFELDLLLIRPATVLSAALITRIAEKYPLARGATGWIYGLCIIFMLIVTIDFPLIWKWQKLDDFPVNKSVYPHVAMSLLKPMIDREKEIRVWNSYGWGGYIGWIGEGHIKIYIDGRTPTIFSQEILLNEKLASHNPRMLRSLLDQWKVDAVVLRKGPILPLSPYDREWLLIGFDHASITYLRKELVQRYDLPVIRFDPFNRWHGGDLDAAIKNLNKLLAMDENNELAWLWLGQLQYFMSDTADKSRQAQAIEAFQHALALNPKNVQALMALARLQSAGNGPAKNVVRSMIKLLDDDGEVVFRGKELIVASLFLASGYPRLALQVLSPESIERYRQLNEYYKTWSIREAAYSRIGNQQQAELAHNMAARLSLDK